MTNEIEKECPVCGFMKCDILNAEIRSEIIDKETKLVSYNVYRCLSGNNKSKRHQFKVKRAGNTKEQALTEKYIKSGEIKLKK